MIGFKDMFLNVFPELLFYGGFGPLILRLVLGGIFITTGYLKLNKEEKRWILSLDSLGIKKSHLVVRLLGAVEMTVGTMLIFGFYTQLAALVIVLISFSEVYIEMREELIIKRSLAFYILTLAIALALMFLGAGFLAFDLPL